MYLHCVDTGLGLCMQKFCVGNSYVNILYDNKYCFRAIVIDTLIHTAGLVGVENDALFLGVFLFDQYIDIMNFSIFYRTECLDMLLEIGCTCLWIAAKFEQGRVPRMAYFGMGDLRGLEQQILVALDYHLLVPTVKTFHRVYLVGAPPMLYHLSGYLMELALIDVSMLSFAPSMVAASAIVISAYLLHILIDIEHLTGYKAGQLRECVTRLMGVHYAASTTQGACYVSFKYLDGRRGSVAMIPPVNLE
jgi:cyclin A